MRLRAHPIRRKLRGFAIVEFALGAGVLVAAFSGTFEIGFALVQYSKLEVAVAHGAEYASKIPYDSATSTPSSSYVTAVRNMVLCGNPTGCTSPVIHGLSAANIAVTVTFAGGVPASIAVSITGYSIDALFGALALSNKPKATYPYQGVWAPV